MHAERRELGLLSGESPLDLLSGHDAIIGQRLRLGLTNRERASR
jgi:hypothetical protein